MVKINVKNEDKIVSLFLGTAEPGFYSRLSFLYPSQEYAMKELKTFFGSPSGFCYCYTYCL
jgi:hypothetical protein